MTDRERLERVIVEVLHDHGATTGLRKATERPEDCPGADAHFGTAPRILAALEAAGYAVYRPEDCTTVWYCASHGSLFPEQTPDKYSECQWMLHEDAWDSLPAPDDCEPVRVLIVPVGGDS